MLGSIHSCRHAPLPSLGMSSTNLYPRPGGWVPKGADSKPCTWDALEGVWRDSFGGEYDLTGSILSRLGRIPTWYLPTGV